MVDIPAERVADALHTELNELPTGYTEDIVAAEHVIEEHVEPKAQDGQADAVETTAVYVAAAFIAGTEGDAPVSSVNRESTTVEIDVGNMSPEARDHWARAVMVDPTNGLDAAAKSSTNFQFSTHGSQSGQGRYSR